VLPEAPPEEDADDPDAPLDEEVEELLPPDPEPDAPLLALPLDEAPPLPLDDAPELEPPEPPPEPEPPEDDAPPVGLSPALSAAIFPPQLVATPAVTNNARILKKAGCITRMDVSLATVLQADSARRTVGDDSPP
jgi:hypothetical protein